MPRKVSAKNAQKVQETPRDPENIEAERAASSPLALVFELVGCEYATQHHGEDTIIPTYTFRPPCVRGKSQPDQDCRDCAHVRFTRLAQADLTHRYQAHGAIIPLTEAQAGKVLDDLASAGATPLERPTWKDAAAAEQKLALAAEARHAAQRARNASLYQQQAGPYGQMPNQED